MLAQHQVENMTFQQSAYSEAMQFQTYMDGAAMDSAGNNLIDPDLKTSMSPTHVGNLCDPPQIQRFLLDSCNSTYIGHQQVDPKFQGSLTSTTPNGVAPIPSALPHRQDSPPFTHPSSTCSSALSPAMESDYYHVQSPPTPTDTQPWSTSFSNQYEPWGSHGQLYHQYTGLADDCVKPIDVYPLQDDIHGLYEESNMRAGLLTRGLSMSSDDSCSNAEQWSQSELSQLPQTMSPDAHAPEVKEEIHIPELNLTPTYPPIETDDEPHSADEIEHPNVKIEDEDEEYQPNKRPRRSNPHPSRASKAQKRANSSHTSHAKRIKTESNNTVSNVATAKASLKGAKRYFPCKECRDITFKDENGLQKHIKTQHTRPFICVFHFAGCKSTFASKNEWKRHCSSQHLLLSYWLCQQDQCAKVSNATHTSTKPSTTWQGQCNGDEGVPTLPNGAIFNRKDLYTQHLRRMHVPPNVKKQVKQKKPVPEWEDNVRSYQDQALRTRCHLPNRMDCPAPGCKVEFEGASAWDERMEHVAKHLDKAGLGLELPISFGGDHDTTLIEWATRPEVSIIRRDDKGRWELHNPLRPTGHPRKGMTADEDEDAEGEEFDE